MTDQYVDLYKGDDVFLDVLTEKVAQNLERRQSGERRKFSPAPSADDSAVKDTLAIAQYMIAARRHREEVLGIDLFGEPAWDIMLDLFVAAGKGRNVSVSSACIAANVPATTALRWISALEKHGIIARREDAFDMRRTWLNLTPEWVLKIDHLLSELASGMRVRHWIAMSK